MKKSKKYEFESSDNLLEIPDPRTFEDIKDTELKLDILAKILVRIFLKLQHEEQKKEKKK